MKQVTLQSCDNILDLGVIMDKKLNFKDHINKVICRGKRGLGFLIRNSRSFKNIRTFKILYFALVRSHMESGSLVWNPILKKHSVALENIQRRFLKYVYSRIFQYYPFSISYAELLAGFEIDSLENRRRMAQLNFLHSVLQGHTNYNLLREIKLRVPRPNSRLHETFYADHGQNRALRDSYIYRACTLYNDLEKKAEDVHIDILSQSKKDFTLIVKETIPLVFGREC